MPVPIRATSTIRPRPRSSASSASVSASVTGTKVAPACCSRTCAGVRCSRRKGPYWACVQRLERAVGADARERQALGVDQLGLGGAVGEREGHRAPGLVEALDRRVGAGDEELEVVELGRRGAVLDHPRILSDLPSPSLPACLPPSLVLPVVAEIVRSGFVEGHHYGSLVALAADGSVDWSVGDVAAPVLPRSCNKPIQALAMVELGLDLPDDLLALACASHSGETFHVDGVRRTLASAGLDESALQTPVDYPLDDAARDGGDPRRRRPLAHPDELLGQARRDARHLRAPGLGHRHLPPPRPPAAGRDPRDLRPDHRRARRHRRRRRLRGAPALDLADRPRARLRDPRDRHRRARAPDRRGHPPAAGLRQRHHPRRARAAPRDPRADRQGGCGVGATPSRCPTAAPGRSRPTTAPRGCGRC